MKLYVFGITCFLWIIQTDSDQDASNTCTFHYWKVDWTTANKTCEADNKTLLCYNSKKQIEDITEAFKLSAYGDPELELWLSHRNCLEPNENEKCLSLHVKKTAKSVWHYFQTNCHTKRPYICCVPFGNMSSESPVTIVELTSTSPRTVSKSTTAVQTSTLANHCQGEKRRGIDWPNTKLGEISILPCPGNSVGEAKWICGNENGGKWSDEGPDLRNCRSLDIKNIKDMFKNSSVTDTISLIGETFEDREKEVFVEDLSDIVSIMRVLPDKLSTELGKLTDDEKWSIVSDVVEKSTSVVDRVIELHGTWKDVAKKNRSLMGTDLLSTIDGFGLLLADTMKDETSEKSVIGKNMALQVLRAKHGEAIDLPQWTVTSHYSKRGKIILDEGYDSHLNLHQGNISVIFTLYSNLTSILEPQVSQKVGLIPASLNSAVLSATVTQARRTVGVSSKVKIFVEHLNPTPNDTICVFWNMDKSRWDTWGCKAEENNATYTLCVCDHLTNFAVLMDYKGVLDDVNQQAFNYITIIGCSLSIISLAICVIVFSCYSYLSKHSWGLRYVIHRNLCLTLLIANLVLVLGIDKTDNQNVCAIVAGMLHYFFLSAFSWMLLEGVHIYMLLVVVFASRRSHWEKYYLFGYGFPLIVVAITAIARPMYYGTDEVCWLSIEKGTIWAFMGPVACILLLNVAALILAQYKASNISIKDDNISLAKRWLRITFILFPVLGITWLLGFMYTGKRYIVIGYLFAVLNSLQGFCIFVCHCIMDKKARNMVLASFKKKNASVSTGSSGTQKKQNISKDGCKNESESRQNGTHSNVESLNNDSIVPSKPNKKVWTKWHKPWTYCFEMPTADKQINNAHKTIETPTKPVMLQWNKLREK